jgi:golgin subfamily B member 1
MSDPEADDRSGGESASSAVKVLEAPPSLVPPADVIIPPAPPSLVPPMDLMSEVIPAAPLSLRSGARGYGSASRIPAAASSRSLPPLPAVEPILEQAADARARADWDTALEHYKKALFVLDNTGSTDKASRTSIYASVAEVKAAQGKMREAEATFEKALATTPGHLRSIDGLVALAETASEWPRVVTYRLKRAEVVDDVDDACAELCRVADVLDAELGDTKRAVATLERALLLLPGDTRALRRLEPIYTKMRAWPKLVEVHDALCRASNDAKVRGAHRFAQADVELGRLRDEPKGLAFLELALDEDPQSDRALSALIAVRTRREEWAELAAVYERLLDRLAGLQDRERAWEVCRKLATLRRDRLLDGPGALEAFRGACELVPDDVESRAALAELYANKGDRTAAVRELEIAAASAPTRAQTFRRLYDLHSRAGRPDRAWLVATCLEELGVADVSHELVIEQFRPDGPIRPTTAVDAAWWDEHLRAPGADAIVCDVLRAVSRAAIELRLGELEAKKLLPVLDPTAKQDRATTASVVRTFVWSSRALGIPLPDLYLLEDVPSGIAAVPSREPVTALGPAVRTGKTVQQLAFLAGRHLTYYRPEHYALVFFPTLAELSSLVLAAVRLVIPGLSVPPSERGSKVPDKLGSALTPEEKASLEAAVSALDDRGGKLDLLAWIRSVELTATRAGMLLAGDLRVATRTLKEEERAVGELSYDAKRADLLAFVSSDAYGTLRERMGVAVLPNLPPASSP